MTSSTFLAVVVFSITAFAKPDLKACHENSKPWDVHPGHFYDKEIHLVPNGPPFSEDAGAVTYIAGYTVVFVKKGSAYDKLGIKNGDILTSIDGISLDSSKKTASDQATFAKLKMGKKFTLQRCLSSQ